MSDRIKAIGETDDDNRVTTPGAQPVAPVGNRMSRNSDEAVHLGDVESARPTTEMSGDLLDGLQRIARPTSVGDVPSEKDLMEGRVPVEFHVTQLPPQLQQPMAAVQSAPVVQQALGKPRSGKNYLAVLGAATVLSAGVALSVTLDDRSSPATVTTATAASANALLADAGVDAAPADKK